MPILNLPDTIEIPFDSLTNEQRSAIHTVMTGKGLDNPLSNKIDQCRAAVRKELTIIRGYELSTPAEQGGDCPTCPLSQCPLLIQQQRVEIAYQLELLVYWLDALELHTDKLSGSKVEFIDNFFQRLSTAGSYTSALKSITGDNKEKFSFIFRSLMGAGDNCLDKILNDFWGNCSEGTICGSISSTSGVVGLAEWVCKGNLATEVITCFLPSLIDCIKKLIDEDDLNYCQAQKLVEKYAASQRLTSDALTDPIIGTVIKKIFATPALTDALRELENAELSEDFLETTEKFFPEFTDDADRNTDCVGSPLVIVGEPGIQGVSGTDGCRGPQGPPGPPGTDGSCDFENPCVDQTLGACCINGFCLEVTNSQCAFYNGSYYGDDFPCSDVVDCVSDTCGSNQDCQVDAQGNIIGDGTQVCCGGQCINPCPNAECGSACPPCAPFPAPCCDGCGGGPCCEEPNICCNGSCVGACPGGGCPDCQGSCCPEGFTCCGSDGCCPNGGCCNGECCSGDTPLCCEGTCSASGNGEGCCGGRACVAGEKCCGGTCVPNPDGKECCNDGPPCADGETCCEGIGCQSDTECISSITDEVCGTISACANEECPQCCEGEIACQNGINCCGVGENGLDQHCCAYDASYCCDSNENCTENCGCCDGCCKADGECVPPCPPEEGGGCQCGDECCGPYEECGYTCNRECQEGNPDTCCQPGEALNSGGQCVQTCQNLLGCAPEFDCATVPDGTVCNSGCPCPSGQDCCGTETFCCDFETQECCNGQCVDMCPNYEPGIPCDEQTPTYVPGCNGDCTSNAHGCCSAGGGECCGNPHTAARGTYKTGAAPACCAADWDFDDNFCCPEGFSCCNFQDCPNIAMPPIFACNYCGRTDGVGVVEDKPAGDGPVIGYSGTTCCLDGIESCTFNGCVDTTDEVWMGGGFFCGDFNEQCDSSVEQFCYCERYDDVSYEIGCPDSKYCQITSTVLCASFNPFETCEQVCDAWSGCSRDYDPEGACCYHAQLCRGDLTESQCEDTEGDWQGPDTKCSDASVNCVSDKNEPCVRNSDCISGLECCSEFNTCKSPGDCPEPPQEGRCCEQDPPYGCTNTIENDCSGAWKPDQVCPDDFQCDPPDGECIDDNNCDTFYQKCIDNVCTDMEGACCQFQNIEPYEDPDCIVLTYPQCQVYSENHEWLGIGDTCEVDSDGYGVCECDYGNCCTYDESTGTYVCDESCERQPGFPLSYCRDRCENAALNPLGVAGVWSQCTTGVCENPLVSRCQPYGACCEESADEFTTCTETYEYWCECELDEAGWCRDGIFAGNFTTCTDADGDGIADVCEEPEYCCCCDGCRQVGTDGTCDVHNVGGDTCCTLKTGSCATGSSCSGAPAICSVPGSCPGTPDDEGACCFDDERNCEITTFAGCDGVWNGYGSLCLDAQCPLRSACCVEENCTPNVTESECTNQLGGIWQDIKLDGSDDGYTCEEVNNCEDDDPILGACCFCPLAPISILPAPCTLKTRELCQSLGGQYTFKGEGTSCEPGACGSEAQPRDCCPTCIPPIGDPGYCCECIGDGTKRGIIRCGSRGTCSGEARLGPCPGEGTACTAGCCMTDTAPCVQTWEYYTGSEYPGRDDDGRGGGNQGGTPPGGRSGRRDGRYGEEGGAAGAGFFTRENGRRRRRTRRNLPLSPCGGGKEFCVEENGTAKCCRVGEVCCNGDCVPADPRGVCSYSSVTEKYYYCPTGYCETLDRNGRVVSRNSFGDRSNCPEFNGERNFLASPTNSLERTYSAFVTYTENRDVILQRNFDEQGKLDNYFIVVKERAVVGRQNTLATQTTITGINASTDRPQQIITAPVNFQIVNFVADDKLKVNTRPSNAVGGVFKTRGSTDTQSKISKAELNDNPAIGRAGFESKGTRSQAIKGSLTTTISNDGTLSEAQVMTFVSGSNIRLDTNVEKSFIRINVDDLNLWELLDVDDGVSAASNGDVLQYNSTSGLWEAVAVATGPTGAVGATGPVAGADKEILFNYNGGASGSPRLKFDYSTNDFIVGAGVTASFSGGLSAGGTCEFNDSSVHKSKLNDYSEKIHAVGTISTTPYALNIENGNVQTFTAGGNFTLAFTNPPASGAAGSLTLIITNGGAHTITFPSAVKWSSGVAPTLTTSGTDILSFTTIDGGTTWYGFVGGLGFA